MNHPTAATGRSKLPLIMLYVGATLVLAVATELFPSRTLFITALALLFFSGMLLAPLVVALRPSARIGGHAGRDSDRDVMESLAHLLPASPDPTALATLVAAEIPRLLRVDTAELLVVPSEGSLGLRALDGAPGSDLGLTPRAGGVLDALRTQDAILILEDLEGIPPGDRAALAARDIHALLPLRVGERLLGAVALGARWSSIPYGPEDHAILTTTASQIATAMENGRLLDQERRTAAHHGQILAGIATGVVVIDPAHCVVAFNRVAETLLNTELFQGQRFVPTPPLDAEIATAATTGTATAGEFTLATSESIEKRIVHYRVAPLRSDSETEPIGIQILLDDITQARRQQGREDLNSRLQSAGEVAATVIHDIKNSVFGIDGAMRRLARAPELEERHREMLDEFRRRLVEIQRLAVAPLDFLRLGDPTPAPVDLCNLVRASVGSVPLTAADVEFDFNPRTITIEVDPNQMRAAINHLYDNSLWAIQPSGRLSVTVRVEGVHADHAVIEFRTSGRSIPDDLGESVFEPFVSTRPGHPGLGLTVVRQIVQAHGGTVEATSRSSPDSTCITIRLPHGAPQS